jgi:DNA invertase Pin-like site-specific DNA recombinase
VFPGSLAYTEDTMRVAGYIRTSRGEKCSDPARQRNAIDQWIAAHGHVLVEIYEDRGGARSEAENIKKRPDFIRLLADAKTGAFQAICVEEYTRFGTADVYEFMGYAGALRRVRVQLWEARGNRLLNDKPEKIGEILTNSVLPAHSSTQESMDKSSRSLGGKLDRASRGLWQGGTILGCSAVECRNVQGELLWVVEEVDGELVQTYPGGRQERRESFPTDRQTRGDSADRLRLVPSNNPQHREAVRLIFNLYDQGVCTPTIAHRLNALGYCTNRGTPYYSGLIPGILRGSHFAGRTAYGKERKGKHYRKQRGQELKYERVEDDAPAREYLNHSDWLLGPEFEGAIISFELWERCQSRMDSRYGKRSPRNLQCWLSPVLYCGDCGQKMTAWMPRPRYLRYGCQKAKKCKGGCHANTVSHHKLEAIVHQYLADTGQSLAGLSEGEGLAPLYAQQVDARTRLGEIRLAIESYLYDKLGDYYQYKQTAKGYRVFQVPDLPDGSQRVRLPDFTGRHEAISWLLSELERRESAQTREALAQARVEHSRLSTLYRTDLPPLLREQLLADIRAQEAEIERLEGCLSGLGSQLLDTLQELRELAQQIEITRELLQSEDAARKAAALQSVIKEIRCEFGPISGRDGRERRGLTAVRITPVLGESRVFAPDALPSSRPPVRPRGPGSTP